MCGRAPRTVYGYPRSALTRMGHYLGDNTLLAAVWVRILHRLQKTVCLSAQRHRAVCGAVLSVPMPSPPVALRVSTGWGEHAENGPEAELLYAAVGGNTDAVKGLLTEQPRLGVNAADTAGNTALMRAAGGGHLEMVAALLAAPGIDVNAANRDGNTALMRASKKGHTSTVIALLASPGIDVNAADEVDSTALMQAATGGYTETVMALLAMPGIDVNKTDGPGNTALVMAARGGYTDTAKVLRRTQGWTDIAFEGTSLATSSPATSSPAT